MVSFYCILIPNESEQFFKFIARRHRQQTGCKTIQLIKAEVIEKKPNNLI